MQTGWEERRGEEDRKGAEEKCGEMEGKSSEMRTEARRDGGSVDVDVGSCCCCFLVPCSFFHFWIERKY